MSIQEYQDRAKAEVKSWKLMRKFIWICVIALLAFAAYAAFYIYYPYSDGTRTGVLRKLSHKGYVFKTWEGELQMPGAIISQGSNDPMMSNSGTFQFSVERGDDAVIQALQEAEQKGSRVTLHYKQYLKQFDWRGETVYFVDKVTIQQ
jgi:uncharacterized protein YwgA